jgi:hypothetical protein
VNSQAAELAALVTWQNAKISVEQAAGMILEVNRVAIEEAQSGKVGRQSVLPANLPETR